MVHFVGAGSGAADLITVRGARLLHEADVVIYAGSLVNPELLAYASEAAEIHNSAAMTLEEVMAVIRAAEAAGKPLCACIQAIQASMARCGSSLICLKPAESNTMYARA